MVSRLPRSPFVYQEPSMYITVGKYADSHKPTKNRTAYNCGAVSTVAEQNVQMLQRISTVGIKIEGRTRVASMTAGN